MHANLSAMLTPISSLSTLSSFATVSHTRELNYIFILPIIKVLDAMIYVDKFALQFRLKKRRS